MNAAKSGTVLDNLSVNIYIYIYIYIYIVGGKRRITTSSSLQACFVVAHSSGENNNLLDRIDFIMFPVLNEKQRSSVVLITMRFL